MTDEETKIKQETAIDCGLALGLAAERRSKEMAIIRGMETSNEAMSEWGERYYKEWRCGK